MRSLLVSAALSLATAVNAQTLDLSEPWFQRGPIEHTWKYRVALRNLVPGHETTFDLSLRLPQGTSVCTVAAGEVTVESRRQSPYTHVRITATPQGETETFTLIVSGFASEVTAGPPVEHRWHVVGRNDRQLQVRSAPVAVERESFVKLRGLHIDPTFLLITSRYITADDDRDPGRSRYLKIARFMQMFNWPVWILRAGFGAESPATE